MLVASSHVFLAIIGFRQPYYNLPAGRYFSISLIFLGWSVFCIAFINAGLAGHYPFFYIGSPLFSGLIPTSFFLYCQSVTRPTKRPNPWWLLFALPGFVYGLTAYNTPSGIARVAAVWDGQNPQFHLDLTPLFLVHTTVLLSFSIASIVVTLRARRQTNDPVRRRTLNWLSSVIFTGIGLIIMANLLPLLGLIRLSGLGFQSLTTVPIAILMYRSLRAFWDEDAAMKQEEVAQQERLASLGCMARGVAHDINNLLMGITGHTELARIKQELPSEVEKHLQKALQIASRASELQHKLQTFSGGLSPRRTPVSATDVLMDLVDETQEALPEDYTLTADIDARESSVCIGAAELHGAVNNLILNAMEAMPNGGKIHLRAWPLETSNVPLTMADNGLKGPCLQIEVQDDGHGMPAETCSRALEPFYSTKGAGRGLGLVSVLAVVRDTAGTMDIKSSINQGTTVRLWLPITTELAPPAIPEEPGATFTTHKVLLIDDDPEVLAVLAELLKTLNQEVVAVLDGAAALEAVRQNPKAFAWALVDIQMPGTDGIEVTKELRRLSKSIRVCLMSGDESADRITKTFGVGFVDFLRKPITLSKLKMLCATSAVSPQE